MLGLVIVLGFLCVAGGTPSAAVPKSISAAGPGCPPPDVIIEWGTRHASSELHEAVTRVGQPLRLSLVAMGYGSWFISNLSLVLAAAGVEPGVGPSVSGVPPNQVIRRTSAVPGSVATLRGAPAGRYAIVETYNYTFTGPKCGAQQPGPGTATGIVAYVDAR